MGEQGTDGIRVDEASRAPISHFVRETASTQTIPSGAIDGGRVSQAAPADAQSATDETEPPGVADRPVPSPIYVATPLAMSQPGQYAFGVASGAAPNRWVPP